MANKNGFDLQNAMDNFETIGLQTLRELITEADKSYRISDDEWFTSRGAIAPSDKEFDEWCDHLLSLEPNDPLLDLVGFVDHDDPRMEALPIPMGSMYKIKTIEEYFAWLKSKGIPNDTTMIISMKYDGISMAVDEEPVKPNEYDAWTRGDGVKGQKSNPHYKLVPNGSQSRPYFSFGEMIMPAETFFTKYDANTDGDARNFVAGQFNTPNPKQTLLDTRFVRYGLVMKDKSNPTKQQQLDMLNELNTTKAPYLVLRADEITHDLLYDTFAKWRDIFAIDGLIIDIDEPSLRMLLGRETQKNAPAYARAFKGDFEETKEVPVIGGDYKISKGGLLKPRVFIEPTKLDGATVRKATGYNARFIIDNQIGVGAIVKIKRSGMVIPKIVGVVKTADVNIPYVCPSCGEDLHWTDSKADLQCINDDCPAIQFKRILSFFVTIKTKNVAIGTVDALYNAGYDTLPKIFAMTLKDFETLPRFGTSKARKVHDSIRKAITDIPLHVYMHATGYFKGLGSRKLIKILEYISTQQLTQSPTYDDISKVEGFAKKSIHSYFDGRDKFKDFATEVAQYVSTVMPDFNIAVSGEFADHNYVFTGFRDDVIKSRVEKLGGKVSSAVSGRTTHLVMADLGDKKTKYDKAVKNNCTILSLDDLMKELDNKQN